MVTWTKLKSGEWGLRSTIALIEGEVVMVSRANGSRSNAVVGRRVWTGNGVWLYATAPKAEKVAPVAPKPLILDWTEADGEDAEMAAEMAAERAANCADDFFGF